MTKLILTVGMLMIGLSGCLSANDNSRLKSVLEELDIPTSEKILASKDEFLRDLNRALESDKDDLLVLVDKKHLLDKSFVPDDLIPLTKNSHFNINRNDLSLRKSVLDALIKMSDAAKKDGITILVSSTYRSYDYQAGLYARNVKQLGKAVADRESAPPGASQHQLGAAIDFGSITDEFAETKQGKWLFNNAPKFGFSLSFPDGYEHITGFRWECWHYRYIGLEATVLQQKWFNNVQQYMIEFIDAWKSQA